MVGDALFGLDGVHGVIRCGQGFFVVIAAEKMNALTTANRADSRRHQLRVSGGSRGGRRRCEQGHDACVVRVLFKLPEVIGGLMP